MKVGGKLKEERGGGGGWSKNIQFLLLQFFLFVKLHADYKLVKDKRIMWFNLIEPGEKSVSEKKVRKEEEENSVW